MVHIARTQAQGRVALATRIPFTALHAEEQVGAV